MLSMMLLLLLTNTDDDTFKDAEKEWRAQREEKMKADTSWFNVAGLFWLEEGQNTFGTAKDCAIVLPKFATVAVAGSFVLKDGEVTYAMNRGQRALVDDQPGTGGVLKQGQVLSHNHLRMFLIERGGKLALRVRNMRAENFLKFDGLSFYRPREKYVVEATFEPYEEPESLMLPTIINTEIEWLIPGKLRFTLKGKEYTLLPTLETMEDEEYFLMFKDETSGSSTYGGGRYLYVPRPVDGKVTLNFNRAINPPCAYTDFATCPIPPEDNHLALGVEAGERTYKREDGGEDASSDH